MPDRETYAVTPLALPTDTSPSKDGPALRTRFDRLVRMFREAQRASVRASGTTEEYRERDVLLQAIVSRMGNWKELADEEKPRKERKTRN
ncbi:hypothetical protein GN244_ATG01533 [Phytophthora infestans]|nr:hypothetical protein GN244_ATG01533 [Phytophthora infestans]KAI9992765.1 hypothetical protein PInf_014633 [Phytophthora infestans]KAI9992767.1 hypothetical protein PInf_014635 [Phytophthora infestans]